MEQKVLEAAYGGLLHDIGKPLQRAAERSDLTEEELTNVPWNAKGGFPTHLHAGYTSRFLARQLGMYNEFESMVSMHHLSDSRPLASWIRQADWIASGIDRNDVRSEEELSKGKSDFRQTRLSSIFELVDFGKEKQPAQIELSTLESTGFPKEAGRCTVPGKTESVEQYQRLMDAFEKRFRRTPACINKSAGKRWLECMACFTSI